MLLTGLCWTIGDMGWELEREGVVWAVTATVGNPQPTHVHFDADVLSGAHREVEGTALHAQLSKCANTQVEMKHQTP